MYGYSKELSVISRQTGLINLAVRQCSSSPKSTLDEASLRGTIGVITKKLYLTRLEDWYDVPKIHIEKVAKLKNIFHNYDSVEHLVKAAFPNHPWEHDKFLQNRGKAPHFTPQTLMQRVIATLFAGYPIKENVKGVHGMRGPSTRPSEVDVVLPSLKLGFEYQDPHHYFTYSYGKNSLAEFKSKDKMKAEQAKEKGFTLIIVPFWWDWGLESLVATIREARPELLTHIDVGGAAPISQEPPQSIINKYSYDIPGLGTVMLAMYTPQRRSFDPSGWWICEKYDGFRAVWQPKEKTFYSRMGSKFSVCHFISDLLPSNTWLDGEIWFGKEKRDRYQAIKLIRSAPHLVTWDQFKFVVFDCPNPDLIHKPYSERYEFLSSFVPQNNPIVFLVSYQVCTGRLFVESEFEKIRTMQGEGVILRDPTAPYLQGYSHSLYKHKGYSDGEALVLDKRSNTRFLCKLPKLHIQIANPTASHYPKKKQLEDNDFVEMEIGVDDELQEIEEEDENITERDTKEYVEKIEIGKFVTFKYMGERDGKPINPRIVAVRDDLNSWEQVLHGKIRSKLAHSRVWTPGSQNLTWNEDTVKNFFNELARELKFDPLVSDNWYPLPISIYNSRKGAATLLAYYGTARKALMQCYPNIGLREELFADKPKNYWSNPENKRAYFEAIAKTLGIDPLVSSNWYKFYPTEIAAEMKKLDGPVNNIIEALISVYPKIGLKKDKFPTKRRLAKLWTPTRMKQNFDSFARERNLNPNKADTWYSIRLSDLLSSKDGVSIYNTYHSFIPPLISAYPSLNLERACFKSSRYKPSSEDVAVFMDRLARDKGFDPLHAEPWYSLRYHDIRRRLGGRKLVDNFRDLLLETYPNIGLDISKVFAGFKKKKDL